jgi:TolB protein
MSKAFHRLFGAVLAMFMAAANADDRPARSYTISFASFAPLNTDIFIADADGSNARPLLPHPDLDYDATFSADGAWIYFSSRRDGSSDIYRVRPDGSGLERVVDDPAYDDQAALSPDGKSLAFVSSRSGQADIWILDLKSRGLRNVTNNPAGDFRPAWSPDGKRLAFSSDRDSKRPKGRGGFGLAHSTEIYIANADGSDVRRSTQYDEVAGSPRWSADGSKLVFYHATRDESSNIASPMRTRGTTQIVSLDLATGLQRMLTTAPGEKRSPQWLRDGRIAYESDGPEGGIEVIGGTPGARGAFKNPTWSADGKRMLFHRDVDPSWPPHRSWHSRDPQFQVMRTGVFSSWSPAGDRMVSNDRTAGILRNSILLMNPDGSERVTIFTDKEKSALAPAWSPQGDRIAFALGGFFQVSQGAAQADIASIGIDGKSLHVHTDGSSNYGFPSWSGNGRQIVYREASKARNALHVLDLDSGKSRVLITGPAHYNFPGWSPKSDLIAFTSDMDGDYEIYTIRADGTNLKRLTHVQNNDAHSAWSPDGEWIAFSSGRSGFKDEGLLYQANPQSYGEIYVMRADGSDVRALTDDQFEEATLGWRPSGQL